jgi:hypothetical protein
MARDVDDPLDRAAEGRRGTGLAKDWQVENGLHDEANPLCAGVGSDWGGVGRREAVLIDAEHDKTATGAAGPRVATSKKCFRCGCRSGYQHRICPMRRKNSVEEHAIVAARVAAMAGQDDALAGIAGYTADGALSAIALTADMGTDLVIQILRLAYEAGSPAPQPDGSAPDLECIACHRIDMIGSTDSSMAAMVLRIGDQSLPVMLSAFQLRQLAANLSAHLARMEELSGR